MDLLLGGVKGQIAHVEGSCIFQWILLFLGVRTISVLVAIAPIIIPGMLLLRSRPLAAATATCDAIVAELTRAVK